MNTKNVKIDRAIMNKQGQVSVRGTIVLNKDIEMCTHDGCTHVTVPKGTEVNYEYIETHSGIYHSLEKTYHMISYIKSVKVTERAFEGIRTYL